MSDQAQINFLRWLSAYSPGFYSEVVRRATPRGLGWINFVVQGVAAAGSLVMQKKQSDKAVKLQKQALAASSAQAAADREQATKLALIEVNTKRAQAGLGPVDINGTLILGAQLPTVPGLSVSALVKPSVLPWVIIGGVGIAAFFLFKR